MVRMSQRQRPNGDENCQLKATMWFSKNSHIAGQAAAIPKQYKRLIQ